MSLVSLHLRLITTIGPTTPEAEVDRPFISQPFLLLLFPYFFIEEILAKRRV